MSQLNLRRSSGGLLSGVETVRLTRAVHVEIGKPAVKSVGMDGNLVLCARALVAKTSVLMRALFWRASPLTPVLQGLSVHKAIWLRSGEGLGIRFRNDHGYRDMVGPIDLKSFR